MYWVTLTHEDAWMYPQCPVGSQAVPLDSVVKQTIESGNDKHTFKSLIVVKCQLCPWLKRTTPPPAPTIQIIKGSSLQNPQFRTHKLTPLGSRPYWLQLMPQGERDRSVAATLLIPHQALHFLQPNPPGPLIVFSPLGQGTGVFKVLQIKRANLLPITFHILSFDYIALCKTLYKLGHFLPQTSMI